MREIKFRAFSIKSKKMIDLARMTSLAVESTLMTQYPKGLYLPIGDSDLILMQYTGLKDKNGVEIYEGDIVNLGYGDDSVAFIGWGEETASFVCVYPEDDDTSDHLYGAELTTVIGNIHQNPELLEISK